MTYAEKLKDPRWQKKRLEILSRDEFACFWCGDEKSTLHVHHLAYEGKNPWETSEYLLLTLCEDCHSIEHISLTELEKTLIDAVRNRDRFHKNRFEMVKILNKIIRRCKGAPTEKDLIVEKNPF